MLFLSFRPCPVWEGLERGLLSDQQVVDDRSAVVYVSVEMSMAQHTVGLLEHIIQYSNLRVRKNFVSDIERLSLFAGRRSVAKDHESALSQHPVDLV